MSKILLCAASACEKIPSQRCSNTIQSARKGPLFSPSRLRFPSITITRHLAQTLLLSVSLGIASNSWADTQNAGADSQRTLVRTTFLETLPNRAVHTDTYQLYADVGEGLIRINAEGKQELGVAARYDIDVTNRSFTFTLRDDVFWSDGEPVVAQDFAQSWKYSLRHVENHVFAGILRRIRGAQNYKDGIEGSEAQLGIETPDDKTLIVHFEKFDRLFPLRTHNPGLYPIPSHYAAANGEDWHAKLDWPTNGAYRFDHLETEPAKAVVLAPNPFHRDRSKIRIERVKYIYGIINDASLAHAFYDAQDSPNRIHMLIGLSRFNNFFSDKEEVHDPLGYNEYVDNSPSTQMLLLDVKKVQPPELLEAIKWLMDPEYLIQRSTDQNRTPAYRMFNVAAHPVEIKNAFTLPYEQRRQKALSLLEDIGVSPENPVTIRLVSRVAFMQPTIIPYLAQFGIQIESKIPSSEEWKLRKQNAGSIDAIQLSWYVSVPDPSGFMLVPSYSGLSLLQDEDNAKFEKLLSESDLIDGLQRLEKLGETEELLVNKGGIIPISRQGSLMLMDKRLCGWADSPTTQHPSMWLHWCPETQ